MMRPRPSWLILLFWILPGCMTVTGRQLMREEVFFDADVEGVRVVCGDQEIITPGTLKLQMSRSHHCYAEREGYQKKNLQINSRFSKKGMRRSANTNWAAWGWWTFGAGLAAGEVVDAVSGASRDLATTNFFIKMAPVETISTPREIMDKVVLAGKAAVEVPARTVTETGQVVVGTIVRGGAEQLDLASPVTKKKKKGDSPR